MPLSAFSRTHLTVLHCTERFSRPNSRFLILGGKKYHEWMSDVGCRTKTAHCQWTFDITRRVWHAAYISSPTRRPYIYSDLAKICRQINIHFWGWITQSWRNFHEIHLSLEDPKIAAGWRCEYVQKGRSLEHGLWRLAARISDSNQPSICPFEKLGFTVVRRVEVLRWQVISYSWAVTCSI